MKSRIGKCNGELSLPILNTMIPKRGLALMVTMVLASCGGGAIDELGVAEPDAAKEVIQEVNTADSLVTSGALGNAGTGLIDAEVNSTDTESGEPVAPVANSAPVSVAPLSSISPELAPVVAAAQPVSSENPEQTFEVPESQLIPSESLEPNMPQPEVEEPAELIPEPIVQPPVEPLSTLDELARESSGESEADNSDSNVGDNANAQSTGAEVSHAVIVGSNPGDATCIHLDGGYADFGTLSKDNWRAWIPDVRYSIGDDFLAVENAGTEGDVIRQKYVPSSIGSARVISASTIPVQKTYRLAQSIYLEPGWDWGGDASQGGKLGFGFGGGTSPSGGSVDYAGFTARIMWRGQLDGTAKIGIYSYAADRPKQYGEDILIENYLAPIGEWINLIIEIQTNSSISSYDGRMRIWLDGEEVLDKQNVGWQLAGGEPSIDSLFYSSFYGGSDSSWAPDTTTYAKVRNVCWSPVIGGYSGIDPDQGRYIVESTAPSGLLSDVGGGNPNITTPDLLISLADGQAEEAKARLEIVAPYFNADDEVIARAAIADIQSARQLLDSRNAHEAVPSSVNHFRDAHERVNLLGGAALGSPPVLSQIGSIEQLILDATLTHIEAYIAQIEELDRFAQCEVVEKSIACEDLYSAYLLIKDHRNQMNTLNITSYYSNAELASYYALNILNE